MLISSIYATKSNQGRQNSWVFPEKKMKPRRKPKKLDTASKVILEEVIGLTTKDANGLASSCSTSKCVYMAGCVAVVYDVDSGKQSNLVVSHRMPKPLSCIAISRNGMFVAAGEVIKPLNQVLSSLVDQEAGHQIEHDNLSSNGTYTVEEFEVRILEPEKSGGPWQIRGTIPMQSSENALTVRVVILFNTTTKENETLLAVGTAYVQGEDVARRGRVLLFSVERNAESSQTSISEVFSKELKGATSAVASLQGHLLIAFGPKVILHKWTGSDLTGVAFYDAPPLYVVSLNIAPPIRNWINEPEKIEANGKNSQQSRGLLASTTRVCYDWSKGAENHNPSTAKTCICLHATQESEVKAKPRVGTGGRR